MRSLPEWTELLFHQSLFKSNWKMKKHVHRKKWRRLQNSEFISNILSLNFFKDWVSNAKRPILLHTWFLITRLFTTDT
jgi:hypothetical protein